MLLFRENWKVMEISKISIYLDINLRCKIF
jgi:hypothetical protein